MGTNQGLAIVDFTESKKIPLFSLNVNRSVVKDKKYSVLLLPSVEDLTKKNIEEAKKRKYKNIAIAASLQDSCILQKDIFSKSNSFNIVSSFEFDPSEREFREIGTRILKSNPDAVFLSTLPPQGALIAKRLRQLGYKGDFFTSIQSSHLEGIKSSEGALIGAWVVTGDSSKARNYFKRYKEKFGSEANDLSIYAYDTIKLIIEGIKSDNLNKYIHNVQNFQGISGNFSSDEHNGYNFNVVIKEFTQNSYE